MTNKGVDTGLTILREKTPGNEVEYNFALDCLKSFKNPRDKLAQLVRAGALIRLKKGIYVSVIFCRVEMSLSMNHLLTC